MMAVFYFLFIAHEKGFKFHAQPQTGAYSCLILRVKKTAEFALQIILSVARYRKLNSVCRQ